MLGRFKLISFGLVVSMAKGLASYCKAETTFTFNFSILTLSNALLGIDNREMKSESGFSFAIASQPFAKIWHQQKRWVFFSIRRVFRTHVGFNKCG